MPLELPVACTLKVVSATPGKDTFELNNLNWGGDARLTGGMWTLTTNKADGFQCPDGSTAPTVDTYKFDDVTLTGTHTATPQRRLRRTGGHDQDAVHARIRRSRCRSPSSSYPLVCEPARLSSLQVRANRRYTVNPPSTFQLAPVMYAASGPAR